VKHDEFKDMFEEEHQWAETHMRTLLDSLDQFEPERAEQAIEQLNNILGPHFRYEEEALYPALRDIHGRIYVKRLYDSHEGTIHAIRKLKRWLNNNEFTRGNVSEAVELINGWMLPHVSDCQGLSIVFEDLSEETLKDVAEVRQEALDEEVPLLEWADTIRTGPEFGTLRIFDESE
jgi:hypothetical protein